MHQDTLVEGIQLISAEKEEEVAVAEPVAVKQEVPVAPAPQAPIYKSAFQNDNDLATVADRIKHIHDLLRNNANGAELVQGMSTRQITEDMLFEGRPSNVRESSSTTVRPDGRISQNPYFRDQAD